MSFLSINLENVNPKFSELFIAIAEESADVPIGMMHVQAVDDLQDNDDCQSMAIFMLLTGAMVGVRWRGKFHFGDVDLMDNDDSCYLEEDGVIIMQYNLEDGGEK